MTTPNTALEQEAKHRSRLLLTLYPITLASLGYAVKMTGGLPVAVVLLVRFGLSALVFSAILLARGFSFRSIKPSHHILRTVLGFASVACFFGSISLIPLSTALCLSYSVPIFSYVLSILKGDDHFDYRVLFVAGAVGAVALIAHPSADVGLLGVGLGLASAFFGAFALFEIKRISKSEGPDAILIMYFLYSTVALVAFVLLFEAPSEYLAQAQAAWLPLFAVGIIGLIYQMTLVNALKLVAVSTVSLTMLVAVALGYGIDVFFLGTAIDAASVIGTLLLALCVAGYCWHE